jgi:hypothetical protein
LLGPTYYDKALEVEGRRLIVALLIVDECLFNYDGMITLGIDIIGFEMLS